MINRKDLRSEKHCIMTERGVISIESLTPADLKNKQMKNAEAELYRIFSKYRGSDGGRSAKGESI